MKDSGVNNLCDTLYKSFMNKNCIIEKFILNVNVCDKFNFERLC